MPSTASEEWPSLSVMSWWVLLPAGLVALFILRCVRSTSRKIQRSGIKMSLAMAILEQVWTLLLIVWYCVEATVMACVPRSLRKRKNVAGEIMLITGAGSGIGRLMAQRFAELGATLVLWDINQAGNEETANQIRENGGKAYEYTVDISNSEKVYQAALKVKQDVGDVTILVNNAGIVTGKPFLECPDHMIRKTMDVNINAHFWTLKAFLPSMIVNNKGHIVNVASMAGIFGMKNLVDYSTSKFAAVGLHDGLHYELVFNGKTGVKTTVICPYFIDTGMFSGVKVKDPLMTLPLLKPSYVVRNIVDSVLLEEQLCVLPRHIIIAAMLKYWLPEKATLLIFRQLGFDDCMSTFVGREKKD